MPTIPRWWAVEEWEFCRRWMPINADGKRQKKVRKKKEGRRRGGLSTDYADCTDVKKDKGRGGGRGNFKKIAQIGEGLHAHLVPLLARLPRFARNDEVVNSGVFRAGVLSYC